MLGSHPLSSESVIYTAVFAFSTLIIMRSFSVDLPVSPRYLYCRRNLSHSGEDLTDDEAKTQMGMEVY